MTVFTNGISDFHKMIITVLKTSFKKCEPKKVSYRNYKNFDQTAFKEELKKLLVVNRTYDYKTFEEVFLLVLKKHAPVKSKIVITPFMFHI